MLENYEKVILTKECVIDPSKVILVREEEKVLKKQRWENHFCFFLIYIDKLQYYVIIL